MSRSIKDDQKKRGRPATGTDPMVGLRVSETLQTEIRRWAKRREDKPKLATAIRQLIEIGLRSAPSPPARGSRKHAAKASKMAGAAVDKALSREDAPGHVKAQRRKHLMDVPDELRRKK